MPLNPCRHLPGQGRARDGDTGETVTYAGLARRIAEKLPDLELRLAVGGEIASYLGAVRPDLPVWIGVGEQDPVNGRLALVNALVERWQGAGMREVTLRVYPGARHEVFNETNRDEVTAELLAFLGTALGD